MKVLVLGAGGMLGTELCRHLTQQGHEVLAVVRPGSATKPDCGKLLHMDLRTPQTSDLPAADHLIYLAQSRKFREFPDEWEDIFDINVATPLKLADWARKMKFKGFHYASSGGVYESGVLAARESSEINANRETGFYIGSRLSAEVLLRNFASSFETLSIVRPFFIYGREQARNMLIPRLVDSVKNGTPITLNGENGIRINPVHVSDAAAAFAQLLNLRGLHALNVAGPQTWTLKDIANLIGEKLDRPPVFKVLTAAGQDLIGDTSLMEKWLVKPSVSLKDGISDLI